MISQINSATGMALLHFHAFALGILLAIAAIFLRNLPQIKCVFSLMRFPKYRVFKEKIMSSVIGKAFITFYDISICFLFSFLLLSVNFIFNSGDFRSFSVITMLAGCFVGKMILYKFIFLLWSGILYLIKLIWDTLSFPIILLLGILAKAMRAILQMFVKRYIQRKIEKYTRYCMENATEISNKALFGNYKDILK